MDNWELNIKIESTQKRIMMMIQTKNKAIEIIEPLLKLTDEKAAYDMYNKFYRQVDNTIKEEAKSLIALEEMRLQ